MKPFIGYKKEPLSSFKLLELIAKFATEPSYYFLRWTHKVSEDWKKEPTATDFPMIEGQMFNKNCELRKCENIGFTTGFMPALYRPRPDESKAYFIRGKVAGRKFYYHTIRAIDKGQNSGNTVQQAGREYTFKTQINFKNLLPEELGTLLIILGQDSKHPIALKVGGGKPIGMGTMTVNVDKIKQPQSLQQRYSKYDVSHDEDLAGEKLQQFIQTNIQAAHTRLIQKHQLEELTAVLRYPSDREPPSGMY